MATHTRTLLQQALQERSSVGYIWVYCGPKCKPMPELQCPPTKHPCMFLICQFLPRVYMTSAGSHP
jgi:hypothetical protein